MLQPPQGLPLCLKLSKLQKISFKKMFMFKKTFYGIYKKCCFLKQEKHLCKSLILTCQSRGRKSRICLGRPARQLLTMGTWRHISNQYFALKKLNIESNMCFGSTFLSTLESG
jgi:hypothetical protein